MIEQLTKQEILAKMRAGATAVFSLGYPNPWLEVVGEVRHDFDTHILMSLLVEGWVKCLGRSHPAESLYVFGANNGPVTFVPEKIPFTRLTSLESVV